MGLPPLGSLSALGGTANRVCSTPAGKAFAGALFPRVAAAPRETAVAFSRNFLRVKCSSFTFAPHAGACSQILVNHQPPVNLRQLRRQRYLNAEIDCTGSLSGLLRTTRWWKWGSPDVARCGGATTRGVAWPSWPYTSRAGCPRHTAGRDQRRWSEAERCSALSRLRRCLAGEVKVLFG